VTAADKSKYFTVLSSNWAVIQDRIINSDFTLGFANSIARTIVNSKIAETRPFHE